MNKKYKVLIIEDHPLIREAYKSACIQVSNQDDNLDFKIDSADNSDDALQKIDEASKNGGVDIIFLDIRLPPSRENQIFTGEDLGLQIRDRLPDSKIIISTTFNDNYRIHSIIKSVNPEGFLIKNDIVPEELVMAIKGVIKDPPYYSQTVVKLLRKEISNNFTVDKTDRTLLHELSLGTKMKDLPEILHLSIAGVEKRKRQLKDVFNIKSDSDKELLFIAKEKGFI